MTSKKERKFKINPGEYSISKNGVFRFYEIENTDTGETYTFDSNMGERNLRTLIRLLNDTVKEK